MKEIFYFRTLGEFERLMDKIDDPIAVPAASIIIDYSKGLYREIDNLRPVRRLNSVKQLGLATNCQNSACASGTRYGHSLTFAAKVDYLAQTHDLEREKAVIAAMLHDIASTPESDSVAKGLGINEEEEFTRILDKNPEIENLLKKYSVSKNELINLVSGKDKTPLGQLINSEDSIDVDRWSYVNVDSHRSSLILKKEFHAINPFKYIKINKGKIIFTDLKSVSQFLEARTQMFEKVYRDSELMAKEAFLEKVTKQLLEKGIITNDSIFEMIDEKFEYLVEKYGGDIGRELFSFGGFDSYGRLDANEEEVENFLRQTTDSPFAVKKEISINPATGTLVMMDKDVKKYKEWEPWHACMLEKRMSAWNHTTVYGYEDDKKLAEAVYKAQHHFGKPKEFNLADCKLKL